MAVLKRSDKRRYGNLEISLKKSYFLGKNNYQDTIPDVLRVLNNYMTEWTTITTQPPTPSVRYTGAPGTGGHNSAVSFLKLSGDGVSFLRATNSSFFTAITCRLCGIKGHYQKHFPVTTNGTGSGIESNRPGVGNGPGGINTATGDEVIQKCGMILSQHNEAYINPNWVLLNSEPTYHIYLTKNY